ncbi:hypothetical protein Aperf_G00000067435 [Anoplocephala perfoliata]
MQSSNSNRIRRIEVNGVSLIDLKAEISRRQTEVKSKATTVPNVSAPVLKRSGGGGISALLKRPASPPKKQRKSADTPEVSQTAEEQAAWDVARRKLEAKARLYDALKQAATAGNAKLNDGDDDKAPLVDFERKAMEESAFDIDSDDDEEDGGRRDHLNKGKSAVPNTEPVSIPDGPVTYAHLRRGEVRDHGTGFYAFSEDAEQRAAEQAALRDLRRRTEQARERVEAERIKRGVALGRRLAQLRARKGLPDVATAAANLLEETSQLPSQPTSNTTPPPSSPPRGPAGEHLGSDDLDIASMLRRLRDEAEEKQAAAAANASSTTEVVVVQSVVRKETTLPLPPSVPRNRVTREWDRGKSFVGMPSAPSSHPPRNKFGASKRRAVVDEGEDRDPEFAPPKFY